MGKIANRLLALAMLLVLSTAPASAQTVFGAWTVVAPGEAHGGLTRNYMHTSSDNSHTLILQCSESFLDFGLDIILHGPETLNTSNGTTNVLIRYPVRSGYRDLSGLDEWDVGWDGRAAFAPVGMTPTLRSVLPSLGTLEATLGYADGMTEVHTFRVAGFVDALAALGCPNMVRPGQRHGKAS